MSHKRKEKTYAQPVSWVSRLGAWARSFWDDFFGVLTPAILPVKRPTRLPPFPKPPFPATANKEAIAELPLVQYEGPIYVISQGKDVKKAVRALRRERVLGFDTETRPVFRRGEYYPVALLQLTGEHGAYIFQLGPIHKHLRSLCRLLADPKILKVGVAVRDDVRKLQERLRFKDAGFVEVSHLTQKIGITHTGLRNLSAILLGVRISKAAQVSNWALRYLTAAQITYAATDAWISRMLYERVATLLKDPSLHCEAKHPHHK